MRGLSKEEVAKRIKDGQVNVSLQPLVKSTKQIVFSHIFTVFNIYNIVIALALTYVKAWTSVLFIFIIIFNTAMRMIQEIRSRNMVMKLNIIVAAKTKVLRDEEILEISNEDIVVDDIILLEAGNQIATDCYVLDETLEVDESLLTGESDPVLKKKGDHLLSGSFVISGITHAKVEHVGKDNYASKIASEARNKKPAYSQLINTFNTVTKYTSYLVVPLSLIMLYQAYFVREQTLALTVINTSTALLGMLPKGLVLLTSMAFIASVLKLSKKNVLVQEMMSIETMAQVDTICLDKTGTLTKGEMTVDQVIDLKNDMKYSLSSIMSAFVKHSIDNNATFETLNNHFKGIESSLGCIDKIPFSSARKWSAIELDEVGTIIVGAPEFILPGESLPQEVQEAKLSGARVLMVAVHPNIEVLKETMNQSMAIGFITILDPLRETAKETIEFFKEKDVRVKVISGDNPVTVSAIAKKAGVERPEQYIDASTLKNNNEVKEAILNYNVIGRATPKQKHLMILALQEENHRVAMTGDGVNDVLALKDADVSIAMGVGSDAAKQVSQFVIVNGDLGNIQDIVYEGRVNINNLVPSAAMYYLKTIYTILVSMSIIFLNTFYPFIPFQMTVLDMFVEGFPSFMLLFEKNLKKPSTSIKEMTLKYSLPSAIGVTLTIIVMTMIGHRFAFTKGEINTILYLTTILTSLTMVARIYKPMNWYRRLVVLLDIIGVSLAVYIFKDWLGLEVITQSMIVTSLIIYTCNLLVIKLISSKINMVLLTRKKREKKQRKTTTPYKAKAIENRL